MQIPGVFSSVRRPPEQVAVTVGLSGRRRIVINRWSYTDGGISAPAPPTRLNAMDDVCRVVVSPIAGGNGGVKG